MPKKHKPKAAKSHQQKPKNRKSLNGSLDDDDASSHFKGFSMRDELRNTPRQHSQWSPAVKLRDQTIRFVSAGSMHPVEEAKIEDRSAEENPRDDLMATQADEGVDGDLGSSEGAMAHMSLRGDAEAPTEERTDVVMDTDMKVTEQFAEMPTNDNGTTGPDMFFVDTVGDRSLAPSGAYPRPRSASPAPSDSSDEVILFRGRSDHVTTREDPATAPVQIDRPATNGVAQAPHVVDALLAALNASTYTPQAASEPVAAPQPPPNTGSLTAVPARQKEEMSHPAHPEGTEGNHTDTVMAESHPAVDKTPSKNRKSKKARKRQNRQLRQLQGDLDEELLQDYIDNMSDSGAYGIPNRPLGLESDEWMSSEMSEDENDEELLELLKDADGEGDDVSGISEISSAYDSEDDDGEAGDSSDLESELNNDEKERWEDDLDLRQRQQDAMTDEEIARILAKQESLGMGGDEMYLFDDSGFGDLETARAGLGAFSADIETFGPNRSRNKAGMRRDKRGRKSDVFPDASLMADVIEQDPYNGFDIMDFDRPSLRSRNKGRKSGGLPAELAALSDDDLIDDLQSSWQNDRRKKAAKKEEREELRKLGLLGGKGKKGKPDMSQRYQEGMDMQSVKIEIRDFLEMEEHTTKAFPPMDKVDRKILHGIAEGFNLKSKSQGSGRNRFTIMIKTQRTVEWSSDHWHQVQTKAQRGFFPNMKTKGKKRDVPVKARAGRGGGFSKAAVGYQNGEVVGAAAPEIAASSFGRKLMEKMGWEKGMALGKEGGEGRLLVPVEARIKSGKAGLG